MFSLSKKCQLLWIIFMLKKSKGKYFLFFLTIGVIASLSKFTTRDKLNISTPSYILILYFFVVLLEVTFVNKNYGWRVIVAIILFFTLNATLSIDNRKSTSNLTSTALYTRWTKIIIIGKSTANTYFQFNVFSSCDTIARVYNFFLSLLS